MLDSSWVTKPAVGLSLQDVSPARRLSREASGNSDSDSPNSHPVPSLSSSRTSHGRLIGSQSLSDCAICHTGTVIGS